MPHHPPLFLEFGRKVWPKSGTNFRKKKLSQNQVGQSKNFRSQNPLQISIFFVIFYHFGKLHKIQRIGDVARFCENLGICVD